MRRALPGDDTALWLPGPDDMLSPAEDFMPCFLAMEEHPIRYFVKNALFTLRVNRNGTQAPVKKRAPAD